MSTWWVTLRCWREEKDCRYFHSGPNVWLRGTGLFPNFYHIQNVREKGLSLKSLTRTVITAKIIVNFKVVRVTLNSLQAAGGCCLEIFFLSVLYRLCWLDERHSRKSRVLLTVKELSTLLGMFLLRRPQTQLSLWIYDDIMDRLHVTSRWPSWWIQMSVELNSKILQIFRFVSSNWCMRDN